MSAVHIPSIRYSRDTVSYTPGSLPDVIDKFMNDLVLLRHFAAMATVADSMPLLSINHYIVGEMLHFMNYITPMDKSDGIVQGVCCDGFVQNVYNNFHIFISGLAGQAYNDFDMTFLEYTVIPAVNSIKRMGADPMIFTRCSLIRQRLHLRMQGALLS